ncbi:unnamed protein product [Paramecium pentaurelia]|uniref:Protein kinase domain-containing protein n=1 Tax=Paramecium pentaurelia TaxID=43138 RepID=A0A8S1WA27_9CILI|nr:unnamed protein product [Paramecium pentaurelia]
MIEEANEQNSPIKFHKIQKKQGSQIEAYYIMRETNLKYFRNESHAKAMLNLRLFNILQPHEIILHQNQILIIMEDWKQYRLIENQLNLQNIQSILFQLAITLNELSQKNIIWNIQSIQQLYLIQGCVFLQLIDLEDSHFNMNIPNIDIFKSFVRKYFPQFNQILDIQMDNFEKIIKYLLSIIQGLKINQQSHYGLNHFFQIKQISSSQGMEDIYAVEFNTPKIFETVFQINSKTLLYRCYDMSRNNKYQLQEYQNREIFITEKLSNTSHILVNFSYIRLFNQAFFFQKKFIMTLADAASLQKTQQIDNHVYKKLAYRALKEIIKGIEIFHQEKIMHRNISPQTIYIDNEQLIDAHFYIGDQEKAKEELNIFQGTQQSTSYQFVPPESMENITMKSDLYQFGLVALFILNKGTILFPFFLLDAEEIEQKFHPDYINNQLKKNKLEYNFELIQVISECLKQNPNQRPETIEVSKKISKIYRNSKIKILNVHFNLELKLKLSYKNDQSNKFKQILQNFNNLSLQRYQITIKNSQFHIYIQSYKQQNKRAVSNNQTVKTSFDDQTYTIDSGDQNNFEMIFQKP